MKRLFLLAMFVLAAGTLSAQNYIIVNSEKIFKSIDAYNQAITALDELAKQYQQEVDNRFGQVEQLYNTYMEEKASLSQRSRQEREEQIINLEQETNKYQESIFGKEGSLMAKRKELIEPIQKKVFAAIEVYAQKIGAGAVFDSANNPALLYKSADADHTQKVIDLLKQK